ncbi:permease prefix domain 1-containing protein [Gracilibacillus caseinilyticus]|uniref:Permease prefix domain 1-containing protein n=1 Tax=Gracilibacillus caseinilyticus TaxID=2932256 RepID=A0ABY4EXU7_9BACI|nr:permease prefix domain 1-containing protein [Gracilibacillus caseinilyticus]UOQ48702.1 permease prefix domain 1-containing protein [Gracilibacillus caseinilyticus]
METIINYLDNMFASLPKTLEMKQLRDELLANMEEKYHELKQDGKTENEAVGIVISEFGNIDEIMEAFDITQEKQTGSNQLLTETEVDQYLETNRLAAKWIGIGVLLCIIGSATIVFFTALFENGYMNRSLALTTGVILFTILVAIAVSLFIYAGLKLDKFKYINQQMNFDLTKELHYKVETMKNNQHPRFVAALICGVSLIILSPAILIFIMAVSEQLIIFGVVVMLTLVAFAIYLFVYFGTVHGSFTTLLERPINRRAAEKEGRINGAIASIIMPLAVIFFLISGFVFGLWHINWLVFPIAGLLIAIFNASYTLFSKKDA